MDGIVVAEVSERFGDTQVLRQVSLSVGKGEFLSLVGPSGCGKTRLMRMIAGLEGVTSSDGADSSMIGRRRTMSVRCVP